MTQNFTYITKYKDNKFEELITKYENNLLNNEIHFNFGNYGRKILEYFVSNYVSKKEKINFGLVSVFKEKYGDLPELVYMSLNVLKGIGNYSSHYDNGNVNYLIDLSTKIQILKSLRLIFDFVLDHRDNNDKFDEEIYWGKKQNSLNILVKHNNDIDVNPSKQSFNVIKQNIGELLLNEDSFFYIPSYQRNYRWTRSTCEELFSDLVKKEKENEVHYFGVMATTNDLLDDSKLQIKLIDGQQRITTSFLFLRSIYDTLIQRSGDDIVPKN